MADKNYAYEGLLAEDDRVVIIASLKAFALQVKRGAELIQLMDGALREADTPVKALPSDPTNAGQVIEPTFDLINGVLERLGDKQPNPAAAWR